MLSKEGEDEVESEVMSLYYDNTREGTNTTDSETLDNLI